MVLISCHNVFNNIIINFNNKRVHLIPAVLHFIINLLAAGAPVKVDRFIILYFIFNSICSYTCDFYITRFLINGINFLALECYMMGINTVLIFN
jgi:hypothetical protein